MRSCCTARSDDGFAEPGADARGVRVSLSLAERVLVLEVPIDERLLEALRDALSAQTESSTGRGAREAADGALAATLVPPLRRLIRIVDRAETCRSMPPPPHLTTKERDLLVALQRAGGRVVPREELLREVWGYGPGVISRMLDTHIGTLRRKLEPMPRRPRHIITVRNVGYRWQD